MKICFISANINNTGGTERMCLLIANQFAKKHNISILSLKDGLNPVFDCDKRITLDSLHLEDCPGFIKRKILPYKRLKEYIKKNKPDILINVDVISCLYTIPMKLFFKIKVIAWEHFNFRINNGVKNRDRARKLSAKFADYIIVLTDADLNEYKNNLRIKVPIKRIYNPIVGKIEKNDLKSKIVLSTGNFSYAKNFSELIYIWEKIENKYPLWKLVICGKGIEFDSVKELAKEKKLKNVFFPGFCKDMNNYYNKTSIFVMTSRFEGFPMVLLEAQQHSIPLIAYDCFTGPSEIIENEKNGYLIKYGDRNEFSNKLETLIDNREKLELFSNNSSKIAKKYSIDKIMEDWEKVLEELNC